MYPLSRFNVIKSIFYKSNASRKHRLRTAEHLVLRIGELNQDVTLVLLNCISKIKKVIQNETHRPCKFFFHDFQVA